MKEKHELIMCIVNSGFSETVIESWITSKEWQICAFHTLKRMVGEVL